MVIEITLNSFKIKNPTFGGVNSFLCGERGIRTPGTLRYNSFQDCRIRPLCHFSGAKLAIFLKPLTFFKINFATFKLSQKALNA
jgi:hypothetical protein